MGINYNLKMHEMMKTFPKGTPLLLQVCCGPCATSVLQRLCEHFAVTAFFYNPNIMPKEEYDKRLDTLKALLSQMEFTYPVTLMESEYDGEEYLKAVKGLESLPEGGERCKVCFDVRLSKTAQTAAENGFSVFCTTLSVSPHKNAEAINTAGQHWAEKNGVVFLASDFKKEDGYKKSIELSRKYGLYRQDYCGCIYSKEEKHGEI